MSAGTTIQIRARVPVVVKVDDQKIFCNSTAGYILYAVDPGQGSPLAGARPASGELAVQAVEAHEIGLFLSM